MWSLILVAVLKEAIIGRHIAPVLYYISPSILWLLILSSCLQSIYPFTHQVTVTTQLRGGGKANFIIPLCNYFVTPPFPTFAYVL